MEYLDIYDEQGNHIGTEDRNVVHRDALWHKTVHCWLYDKIGNIFFQIRAEEGTLYTTASGHVDAGETVKQGFGREIKEEIGIDVDYESATLIEVVNFVMDRPKSDGTVFKDRAFANVFACIFDGPLNSFNFDPNELKGLVRVNAKDTLELLTNESGTVKGTIIDVNNNIEERDIGFNEFLVNAHETAIGKYGAVLKKVIELQN